MFSGLRVFSPELSGSTSPQASPPKVVSWCERYTWRPKYHPSAPPMITSEAKCCCPVTRVALTVVASPYARIFVKVPGYSCAITLATDQAIAECSDGDELPP